MKSKKFVPKIMCKYPWRFSYELAEEIGLLDSIVLLELEYLVHISTTEVQEDGEHWCYLSRADMQEWFPFRDGLTIQRAFDRLVKRKLVLRNKFNHVSYDKTCWYRPNYPEIEKLKSVWIKVKDFGVLA